MSIYLGSWVVGAVATGIAAIVLLFVVSMPAFGVEIYAAHVARRDRDARARGVPASPRSASPSPRWSRAPIRRMPVAQLTFLPISFISGIWFPLDGAPDWLIKVSHFFPLSHIVNAFGSCFVPGTTGSQFHANDLVRDR